ncbi:Ribonuclease T [Halomonadaceae bacterium LMG 33818]|uniref:ribonuclease T n=1 Tax=Cernens ardua TaxID=3402176 RepID=UPI003EDC743F
MTTASKTTSMSARFRGYLPVIIDVETGGFNSETDALLEIGATLLCMDEQGQLIIDETWSAHIQPFEGANIEQSALDFTGIRLDSALRQEAAVSEEEALSDLYKKIRRSMKSQDCTRAILVGHNAAFDHGFMRAANERADIKRNPFHPFSSLDTASLSALAYGQTVLAKACAAAGIPFDQQNAHSAGYDAERTATLFCSIVNRYRDLGGWDLTLREQEMEREGEEE